MTTAEGYYLVLVCGAFGIFAVTIAAAYVKYRNWLKGNPGLAK